MRLTLAHSPDADDAFMFYGLAHHKVDAEGIEFEHTLMDIESLNRLAEKETYDISAVSFHAYPALSGRYALMRVGGSVGRGYGPVVAAKRSLTSLDGLRVASPGGKTTAHLLLRLHSPGAIPVETAFDKVLEAVEKNEADAGVIIHEGQLTYAREGFVKVADFGEWWLEKTGLPLPLGGNIVRRAVPKETREAAERAMHRSIEYGLAHMDEALPYAMQFGRGLERELAERFVKMYVNPFTLDYGSEGRRAVEALYRMANERGFLPPVELDL